MAQQRPLEALPLELAPGPDRLPLGGRGDRLHGADLRHRDRRDRASDDGAEARLAPQIHGRLSHRCPRDGAERVSAARAPHAARRAQPLLHPVDAPPGHLHPWPFLLGHATACGARPGALHPLHLPHLPRGPSHAVFRAHPHPRAQGGARPQGLLQGRVPVPELRQRVVDRPVLWGGPLELPRGAHEDPPQVAQRRRRRAHEPGPGPHEPALLLPLHAPLHALLDGAQPDRALREEEGVVPPAAAARGPGRVLRRDGAALPVEPHLLLHLLDLPPHRGMRDPLRHLLHVARLRGGRRPGQPVCEFRDHPGWPRQRVERGLPRGPPPRAQHALERRPGALREEPRQVRRGDGHHLQGHRRGEAPAVDVRAQLGRHGRALRGPERQAQPRGEEGAHRPEAERDRRGRGPRRQAGGVGLHLLHPRLRGVRAPASWGSCRCHLAAPSNLLSPSLPSVHAWPPWPRQPESIFWFHSDHPGGGHIMQCS
mmetsp:Transcript_61332/g.179883  ORF Transcript_61332/g.179883 Transcript_61332/m.179883 type:complete len:483 (+) Transcript_61332:628-2076(+)